MSEDHASDYRTGIEGMKTALAGHEKLIAQFTRKTYADCFREYYLSLVPAMDAIENLYGTVVEKDTMLSNMAGTLVREASSLLEETPKRKKEEMNIDIGLTMAGYVFPAILRYRGESSRPLADEILRQWQEQFPKSGLKAAEYEEIEAGFHRKFCFITTACCQMLNKPDDCYELTLLRRYRDGYLAEQPDGEELIAMYYDVAPSIVKHINRQPDSAAIYSRIYTEYLLPCIRMIERGELSECRELYTEMVNDLKEKYFLEYRCA